MDSERLEHLMALEKAGRIEEAIRDSQLLLKEVTDEDEKATLLEGIHVSYCKLGRLEEARQTLGQLKKLHISNLEVLLNAEFCEPTFLIQEGKYDAGLSAFSAMLDRHKDVFKQDRFRYLYEDIQRRRALTLFGLSRYKEALPILQEAVSFSFDRPEDEQQVHFALGICLEEADDIDGAKRQFSQVVGCGFKNDIEEKALWRLGILYYKAGALAQAKQQLERILGDFSSQNPSVERRQVYEALSQTCRYLGDETNAKYYAELAKRA